MSRSQSRASRSPASRAPTVLVAVLDSTTRGAVDACLAAGFHSVLVKPLHINDLERLLSS